MNTADPWLSVEEIAQYVGVSKETVYRWLERGSVPSHRIGKLWKFKTSEVDEWVRSGKAAPTENATKRRGNNGKPTERST